MGRPPVGLEAAGLLARHVVPGALVCPQRAAGEREQRAVVGVERDGGEVEQRAVLVRPAQRALVADVAAVIDLAGIHVAVGEGGPPRVGVGRLGRGVRPLGRGPARVGGPVGGAEVADRKLPGLGATHRRREHVR